jgi:hypothetical protein
MKVNEAKECFTAKKVKRMLYGKGSEKKTALVHGNCTIPDTTRCFIKDTNSSMMQ